MYGNNDYRDYLAHYGVLGMKWGVRKDKGSSGKKLSSGRNAVSKMNGSSDSSTKKNRKITAAKAAMVIGGAVAISALAYYNRRNISRIARQYLDQTIMSGTTLHTIERDIVDNPQFYAAFKTDDVLQYRNILGQNRMGFGTKFYDIQRTITSKVKVPSEKNARKIIDDLCKKDAEFASYYKNQALDGVVDIAYRNPAYNKIVNKYMKGDKKAEYRLFNARAFLDHTPESQAQKDKLFSALKKEGYGGIRDINDTWYSGCDTPNAVIFFDKTNIKRKADVIMGQSDINNAAAQQLSRATRDTAVAYVGVYGGATVSSTGAYIYSTEKQKEKRTSK